MKYIPSFSFTKREQHTWKDLFYNWAGLFLCATVNAGIWYFFVWFTCVAIRRGFGL
jgi:hypothetical protein